MRPKLIPELDVENVERSLGFHVGIVGFRVAYERPEERFALLDLDGACLMLEHNRGSIGSLSSTRTANTRSCALRSGAPTTNRISA